MERALQKLVSQLHRQIFELDQVESVRQNVARMAPAKWLAGVPVAAVDEAIQHLRAARKTLRLAEVLENPNEFILGRPAQQHLVVNAAQKSFIAQVRRLQVGRKDQERLEWCGHLAARHESQIVDPPLHRSEE